MAQAWEYAGQTHLSPADAENIAPDSALLKITSAEQNPRDVDLQRTGLAELAEIATSNPSFVVIKGWEDLQAALRELFEVICPETSFRPFSLSRLPDLASEGYVDESFAGTGPTSALL